MGGENPNLGRFRQEMIVFDDHAITIQKDCLVMIWSGGHKYWSQILYTTVFHCLLKAAPIPAG